MQVLPSVCPLDCPDRCALDVTVDNGRVVKIDGSRRSEYTDGYICSKVRRFPERQNSAERIAHPMRRVGGKSSATFERISWDEAFHRISEKFIRLSQTIGPESILPFHYDGSNGLITSGGMDERFWNRLGASQISKTYCAANTGAAWSTVFGNLPGCDPMDVRESDAIVLWGVNPSASGIHLVPWVREAKAKGAFLAVVDPRLTPLARDADLHIRNLPGTDVLVAMAMIRVAHEEGLIDRDFVEQWTRGFDSLLPATCTPQQAAEWSGVSEASIRALPRALGKAKSPFFRVGWGLERNRNGTDSVRAVLSLRAVMGRFGRRGSGILISTSGGYGIDRSRAAAPHLRTRSPRVINMSQLGMALEETRNPEIQALFVYNANPVATAPNQERVIRALSRESLFTVVHEQVWTDTCDYADIVLPATTFLEHKELSRSYSGYALQWSDPVVKETGEAKSNHWVFTELSRAMGFEEPELRVDEEEVARAAVKNVDEVKQAGYVAVPRPVSFVDAFPSRGYIDLAGSNPPVYRPPVIDAHLPLILISPSSDKAITSQLFELTPNGSAKVTLATAEAARRGLRHGDEVRVRNSFGSVVAILAVSDEVPEGVASMPKGLWRRSTKNSFTANALAPDHVDSIGGGACYNDARVEIERS
ncbi:MAG TPA: molybdopterin-dependent oxidoreductase [Terriglobia bacterium]|nr:molybdopterin-dependent oxidoreductase [Terriglobia bacterium]